MSLWQLAHVWLVMKKFDGIVWPTLVFDDDGKNGLFRPAPSASMLSGGLSGFTIRGTARSAIACRPAAPVSATTTSAYATCSGLSLTCGRRIRFAAAIARTTVAPAVDAAMCDSSS